MTTAKITTQSIKKLNVIDYVVISSLYITAGAFCTSLVYSYVATKGVFSPLTACIPAALVFIGYSFDTLLGVSEEDRINKPKRFIFSRKYGKLCLSLAIVTMVVVLVAAASQSISLVLAIAMPELAIFIYNIDLPRFGFTRLKSIVLVKNMFVGGMWSYSVIIIPLVALHLPFTNTVLFALIHAFITLTLNSVLFDIHDIEGDRQAGVNTIPVLIGKEMTLWLALLINTVLTAIFLLFYFDFANMGLVTLLVLNLYAYGYIFAFKVIKNTAVVNVLIDFQLILPGLVFILLRLIWH
jgi:4-hydroxybenzoate polyprenyltransferase